MGENGQRGPAFDHATYSSTGGVYVPAVSDHRFPPIDYDPPEHSAFRRLIAPLTSGAAAKAMEPRIRATVNRDLAFGAGIHTCPGMALAKLEIRAAVEEVLRPIPGFRVAGEVERTDPSRAVGATSACAGCP